MPAWRKWKNNMLKKKQRLKRMVE